jgi:hypothetical protein
MSPPPRSLTREVLTPKSPRNLALTVIAAALMLLAGGAAALLTWRWSPKHGAGLAFGIVGALFFVVESLYPSRWLRRHPGAQAWMQIHTYLGLLALLAVLLHMGFSLPHGWIGWGLLLLSLWVTASGLVGVVLQKRLPAAMADGLAVEALYERIPGMVDELLAEADLLMEEASDPLESFYVGEVRPRLSALNPSWAYLADVRAGHSQLLDTFQRRAPYLDEGEQPRLWDLMRITTDKLELDAQYRLQTVLRRWPFWTFHVPAAGLLMALLVVHVASWVVY